MKQVNDTAEQNNSFRNRKPIDYYKYTREVALNKDLRISRQEP